VPEGPEITTGRKFWTPLEAIVNAERVARIEDLEKQAAKGRREKKQCIDPQWRSWIKPHHYEKRPAE